MAGNTGLKLGNGIKELRLGKSFSKGYKEECYHTIRYDFKPASVDSQKVGTLDIADKEVTLTVPTEGAGSHGAVFKGNKTPASKDCLLIINHETGEIVLERISQHVRVKKTRTEANSRKLMPRGGISGFPESRSNKSSPNTLAVSPHMNKSPPKSPLHKSAPAKSTHSNSGSMPMLNFEEDMKAPTSSIMSDSSSDSDSNSGSSSSSDSDSDSETEAQPAVSINKSAALNATTKHTSPTSILSDLELSEED